MTHTRMTRARPTITLALAATAMLAITTGPETARAMAAAVDNSFAVPGLTAPRSRADRPNCHDFPPQDCTAPAGNDLAGRCFFPNSGDDPFYIQCPVVRCNEGGTIGPVRLLCICVSANPPAYDYPSWMCVPHHRDWPGGSGFPEEEFGDEEQEPGPEVLY